MRSHSMRRRVAGYRQRGVSLIEAVVALAVMGFGILGVVAMQVALRQSGDIAKQRTEATRLAHETIEGWRRFSALVPAGALVVGWSQISTQPDEKIPGSNAEYTRMVTVSNVNDAEGKTLVKNVNVEVQWKDRTGADQSVRVMSAINGGLPMLAVTSGIPPAGGAASSPGTQRPRGRHPSIPPGAVNQPGGTSTFTPPGGGTVQWVFNNATGVITKICASPGVCTSAQYQLLAGFIDFSTGTTQPTGAESEAPASGSFAVDVAVTVTDSIPGSGSCFTEQFGTYVAYLCAIKVDPTLQSAWTGYTELGGASLVLASSLADASASRYRVCRYTPVRDCQPTVGSTIWGAKGATAFCSGASPTPQRKMTNDENPKIYLNANGPLVNQNYLIIRAGDGTTPFNCPADNATTPNINSNTWHHQPAS